MCVVFIPFNPDLDAKACITKLYKISLFIGNVELRFSVSRRSKNIKIKIKNVQQKKSRIWEKKGGKYGKTIAKIFRALIGRELWLQTMKWRDGGAIETSMEMGI